MSLHVSATTGCNLGCSYCHTAGSLVLTEALEWVPIETLSEGDGVVAFDEHTPEEGRFRKYRHGVVTDTHTHEAEVVEVTTGAGTIEVEQSHPFYAKRNRKTRFIEAADLRAGDEVFRFTEPVQAPVNGQYKRGYIHGALAGDGSVPGMKDRSDDTSAGYISSIDEAVSRTVCEYDGSLPNPYGFELRERQYNAENDTAMMAVCDRSERERLAQDWSASLDAPQDDDYARGWLAGMFDTDGSAPNGRVIVFQQYPGEIQNRVCEFLDQLGFDYTIDAGVEGEYSDAVRLQPGRGTKRLFTFLQLIRPKVQRKALSFVDNKRIGGTTTVESVEPVEDQTVYDVTTTEGTLIVDGYLVHQCYENPDRERKQQWVDRQYDIEKIMDQLREWKDKYPHERPGLHGGEPLLVRAEHLDRIFGYMDENWDSDAQHIQTNGTLMTEDHIEIFEEYNVHVGISCDGPLELNRERKAAGERDADESGQPTDTATEKTLEAIEMCKEADLSFGVITVLHERNAGTDEKLERLLDWMDGICASGGGGHWNPAIPYEDINDDEDVSLAPSRLKEVYLRGWEWMKAETYRSWGPMNNYVDNLLGNQVQNCVNDKCDVANAGAAKIIKGNGESTGCGKTWGQYGDGGAFLQGPSTGNNYDDSEERYDALKQTPGWVTDDAPDMGGCKGCKFWNVCYDDETEVLTDDGWKKFEDVTLQDRVATLDQETHKIEYNRPLDKQELQYEGDLLRWEGTTYDLRVTPDHNVFARSSPGQPFENHRATEIEGNSAISFKRGGEWEGAQLETFTPQPAALADGAIPATPEPVNRTFDASDWFEFMGWYLAEGSVDRKESGNHRVTLCQRQVEHREEIRSLLDRMGFSVYFGEKNIEFDSKQVVDHVESYGTATEKHVPEYIKDASSDLIRTFLTAYAKGDGTLRDDGTPRVIYTASEKMADDLHELGLKADWPSSKGVDDRDEGGDIDGRTIRGGPVYYVTFAPSKSEVEVWGYGREAVSRETYEGTVYDLTVPNHTMYVRRNGKALWSGNCSGGCPSAGGDDNYRNRTTWCEAKYALYEAVERDLRALMPNIRLITDLPWDAEVIDLASSRQLDFKPFAAVRPDSTGKSAAMGGADHNAGGVERHVPDDRLPDDAWEREVKKVKEKYPAEDLVINESEQKWHADSDQ